MSPHCVNPLKRLLMREVGSKKLKESRPERCCLLDSTSVGGNQAKKLACLWIEALGEEK